MTFKLAYSMPEHYRIRFADKVCFFTCGNLNRRNKRSGCGHNTSFGRAYNVGVCTNKSCAFVYKFNGFFNFFKAICACFADNNIIGIYVIHINSNVV